VPEGHTIHRLARDLNTSFRGSTVRASSPQGRFEAGAARLDGQGCERFEAFGKHLVGHFAAGDVLHVHLGLIGKFRRAKGDPVGAVRLRLSTDDTNWDLRGPMVCVVGSPELADEVATSVGPDPLRASANVDDFVNAAKRRRIAIGAALLDQKLIAGIGNVYRSEVLFLAGIDPLTPANQLDDAALGELWNLCVEQLRQGEKLNRIVTVDPGRAGYKTARSIPAGERLYLYKREGEPCRVCGSAVELLEVAARKMWWCPQCQ
jgi:endonuclease-8